MNRNRLLLCAGAFVTLCLIAGCGGFWGNRHLVGDVKCNDGTQIADADAKQAEEFCEERGGVDESTWTNKRDN
jgi:hypothetical protein